MTIDDLVGSVPPLDHQIPTDYYAYFASAAQVWRSYYAGKLSWRERETNLAILRQAHLAN